ncbi:MAG: GtrA family protein [Clostridia bacterium]|nr:GtrA family protein [Eubacterium sp.]MBR2559319.1 GtrA family protein [Bacillota bacterium]MCR4669237.1 GtrA family protein [Clostridia bacterium]
MANDPVNKKSGLDKRELIVYFIVGVIVTGVDWVVYSVLVKYLDVPVTPANIAGWIAAVAAAFILNKRYVFLSTDYTAANLIREIWQFVAGRLFSGAVTIALVPLLMAVGVTGTVFGVKGFIAKALASIIGLVLNYIISKFIVFRKK